MNAWAMREMREAAGRENLYRPFQWFGARHKSTAIDLTACALHNRKEGFALHQDGESLPSDGSMIDANCLCQGARALGSSGVLYHT